MTECERRGFHRVKRYQMQAGDSFVDAAHCADCGLVMTETQARAELRKEGDFLLNLGSAVEEASMRELRTGKPLVEVE